MSATEKGITPNPPDVPPQMALFQMATGFWVTQSIYVAARLGIADLLGDGPKTADELARATNTNSFMLYRVLRALAGLGIFAEDEQKRFGLTPLAEALQSGPNSFRAMAIHLAENSSWKAWGSLLESVRTGECAFKLANGLEVFPYYAEHKESFEPFNEAMTNFSEAVIKAIVPAYDFSSVRKLVDIGGGHGALLAAILKVNPETRGVLFDLPTVVGGAKERLEREGVTDRAEVLGGDFFESVPPGGDAYIMKLIIHDWDEERAVKILKNCHSAMEDGGRLLLVETVVPEGNEPSLSKMMDLQMLVMTGGRERTEAEYRELFAAAGFKLTRVIPTESPLSIVEGRK
ncbi:MAG: acetylserotonin O-methyltransferase [Acidobacteriota bacterium]|nr:acetylserotonin O-methyltransferase [Acidobacteriota bacterium]